MSRKKQKKIKLKKLRMLVLDFAGEEQQQFLFTRPRRAKYAAATLRPGELPAP